MSFTVALAGDIMLGDGDFRSCSDPAFRRILDRVRSADFALGHLETLLHDFTGDELYPAVEAGWVWMQSPSAAAATLPWMGFDAVTLASNHCLDFSYGGLRSTWRALELSDVPHAGTGTSLDEAGAVLKVNGPGGRRIGVLSMASSFARSSRAGNAFGDVPARPGLNPLRYSHAIRQEHLEQLLPLWSRMGLWVTQVDDLEWSVNPPGLHNSLNSFHVVPAGSDVTTMVDELDERRHLEAIAAARTDCDVIIVHAHVHEWDPRRGLSQPPDFLGEFARHAIDAGAHVVFAQGSHAPFRGVEVHHGGLIVYDPGDFMLRTESTARHPADFYDRHRHAISLDQATVDGSAEVAALRFYGQPANPERGYHPPELVSGAAIVVCDFTDDCRLRQARLHPFTWGAAGANAGLPLEVTGGPAADVLEHFAALSLEQGCEVVIERDTGLITT